MSLGCKPSVGHMLSVAMFAWSVALTVFVATTTPATPAQPKTTVSPGLVEVPVSQPATPKLTPTPTLHVPSQQAASEPQSQQEKYLLVVASVSAKPQRLAAVRSNLALFPATGQWSCLLLTHETRTELSDARFTELATQGPGPAGCEKFRWEGMHWVGLLKTVHPQLVAAGGFRKVALLLDDVLLTTHGGPADASSFNIDRVLQVMQHNRLGVASLSLVDPPSDLYWKVMQRGWRGNVRGSGHRRPGAGRLVEYVDLLFALFEAEAWTCFHSLLEPSVNTNGWGMDHLLHPVCQQRIGIIDEFAVQHLHGNGVQRVASGRSSFPVLRGHRLNEQQQEQQLVCSKLHCCDRAEECVANLKREHLSPRVVVGALEEPPVGGAFR